MSIDPVSRLEQVIDLAEMSHNVSLDDIRAAIEQHVAEAVAREREECAKACEDVGTTRWDEYAASYNSAVFDCAAAIRTRAEKETFGAYSSKKETP